MHFITNYFIQTTHWFSEFEREYKMYNVFNIKIQLILFTFKNKNNKTD